MVDMAWLIFVVKFPTAYFACLRLHFYQLACGCFWPVSQGFIALVTEFHTIFHTHFVPWLFAEVSLPSRTVPPAWRLTFAVKETYCCFLIPLHPPLHKTMVSIASTEYIHSSEWETAWLGLLASLPTVLPGSPDDLFIPSDSSVFEPADSSCTNITSAACEPALDCDCTATF